MSLQVIIHAGASKCGSSTIQAFLSHNAESLHAAGVAFISSSDFRLGPDNRGVRFGGSFPLEDFARHGAPADAHRQILSDSLDECKRTGKRFAIISAENALCVTPKIANRYPLFFQDTIDRFDVRLIGYVRRPEEWLISAWKQWGMKSDTPNFGEWLAHSCLRREPSFGAGLDAWKLALGGFEKIYCNILSTDCLSEGNIITDFLRHTIGDSFVELKETSRQNVSPPTAWLSLLAENRATLFSNEHDIEFDQFLEVLIAKDDGRGRNADELLSAEGQARIAHIFRDDVERLIDGFIADKTSARRYFRFDSQPEGSAADLPQTLPGMVQYLQRAVIPQDQAVIERAFRAVVLGSVHRFDKRLSAISDLTEDQADFRRQVTAAVCESADAMQMLKQDGDEQRALDLAMLSELKARLAHADVVLEAERVRNSTELERLRIELRRACAEAALAQDGALNAQSDAARSQEELARVRQDLEQACTEAALAQDGALNARSDAARSQEELGRVREDLEQAGIETARVRVEAGEARADALRLHGQLKQLQQDLDRSRDRASRARSDYLRLQTKQHDAETQADEARSAAEEYRRALNAVFASTTWRASAAVRALFTSMPLPLRRTARRVAKLMYWIVTPWKTGPRLRFLSQRRRKRRMLELQAALMSASPLFDRAWYLATYPDVAAAKANPALHYLGAGAAEGRDPGPHFSTVAYLARYPDVAVWNANPLIHYLEHGLEEGRDPSPSVFIQPPASSQPSQELVELLGASPFFDAEWYRTSYADALEADADLALDYLLHGAMAGRDPGPQFNTRAYLARHPDVARSHANPLAHYLMHGIEEGREIFPSEKAPQSLAYRPKISILVPVYNQSSYLLERLIKSVQAQIYPHWELCLSDDGSTKPETLAFLRDCMVIDKYRITVFLADRNRGISAATNSALQLSTGEFVCLLDHDDELMPDALWEVARALNADPGLDLLYSDEDKIDASDVAYDPFHKPDWSPTFAMGVMYVGHLLTIRRSLILEVGGFDSRYDTVQDYELMLRLSERTQRIKHIPKILYHWRSIPGSLARGTDQKVGISALQQAAVAAHLERMGIDAQVSPHPTIDQRMLLWPHPRDHYPLISILIPTRDHAALLRRCLESIFTKTSYPNFEVILIDNQSTESDALALFKKFPVRLLPFDGPFNFSCVNNIAVKQAKGEYILLLNNDTEVITPNWLEILLLHLELPGVAVVGPKLLYPDNSIQHAGVVLGIRGTADHVMRGYARDCDGYFGSLACAREVSAVTGACLMVRRQDYQRVGGLSEDYSIQYQDVDFCCRFLEEGKRQLCVPHVELYHHESATRHNHYDLIDRALLRDVWRQRLRHGDPYYNPNFVLDQAKSYRLRSSL